MEAWQKDFLQLIEAVADGAEQFFSEMTEVVEGIAIEIDQVMTDAIEPILEAYLGLEITVEEVTQPIVQTVNPVLEEHPACIGCRHFHGQAYGGNFLVCAMHPYGVLEGTETCPDKELIWAYPHYTSSRASEEGSFWTDDNS